MVDVGLISEMRKRHRQERIEIICDAVAGEGSVAKGAIALGLDRSQVYTELRNAGIDLNHVVIPDQRAQ